MKSNKKVVVVMPAYNAQTTLEMTYLEIPFEFVDDIILVDDFSSDNTVQIAKKLGIKTIVHNKNYGYGKNQKTCYNEALKSGADIVIMLHPDYQYDAKLISKIVSLFNEDCDCVIASRFLDGTVKNSKMPKYKYFANRILTKFQNIVFKKNLSEYHTGYRAFSRKVLEKIDYNALDDDFIFDNQMLALIIYSNFSIKEIPCPTRYFKEASSINFIRSCIYGLGVIKTSFEYLFKTGLFKKDFLAKVLYGAGSDSADEKVR